MTSDAAHPRRRRILIGLGVVVLLVAAAAAVFFLTREGNVSNPNVEFRAEPPPTPAGGTPVPSEPGEKDPPKAEEPIWPMYGYGAERQRYLTVPETLRPPYKLAWTRVAGSLLEFPPVMSERSLYLLSDGGVFFGLDKRTGKVRWKRDVGKLAASTPAVDGKRVFATVLSPGRVVALDTKTGKVLWSKNLPARSESSPLVADGKVFFGAEDGTVYALRQSDGKQLWTYDAEGAVKGALALKDNRIFFGDYAGKVYAISPEDGHRIWEAKTKGASFGLRSGRFYSTPAVANGRVFIGNVDGYVYSFAQSTGELAWRTNLGGYVYSAPSVAPGPDGEPTVFSGSYGGTFFALDARSGAIKWRVGGFGHISGGSQVLNDIVYFPDLGNRKMIGLDVRSGKKVYEFRKGGFATVITDGETLYLTGYGAIYGLRPPDVEERKARISARAQIAADCRKRFDRKAFSKKCFRNAVVKRKRTSCLRAARESDRPKRRRKQLYVRCVHRRGAAR
jgi:outer membrane protein assembly factor BamB